MTMAARRESTATGAAASRITALAGAALIAAAGASDIAHADADASDDDQRTLRVCADPNNLPFTNRDREGFENRIAALVADEMGADVEYAWQAQRRGFIRQTLDAGRCDVVMGVPAGYERTLTTRPYYRSTYVFLRRADSDFAVDSLNDPVLRDVRIGVHLIGDDGTNTPPAHALGRRGIVDNVRGYMIYGDYDEPNPPARLVEAVAEDDIELAIVWGPFAGYFGPRQSTELAMKPVSPQKDPPELSFSYDIAMGVRREDRALKQELDEIVQRRRDDIAAIIEDYGVPRP